MADWLKRITDVTTEADKRRKEATAKSAARAADNLKAFEVNREHLRTVVMPILREAANHLTQQRREVLLVDPAAAGQMMEETITCSLRMRFRDRGFSTLGFKISKAHPHIEVSLASGTTEKLSADELPREKVQDLVVELVTNNEGDRW